MTKFNLCDGGCGTPLPVQSGRQICPVCGSPHDGQFIALGEGTTFPPSTQVGDPEVTEADQG